MQNILYGPRNVTRNLEIKGEIREELITSSVSHLGQWKNDLKTVKVNCMAFLKPLTSCKRNSENYDYGLLLPFTTGDKLTVFIGLKSTNKEGSSSLINKYIAGCVVQDSITEEDLKNDNGYLRSISDGDWVYLSFSDDDGSNRFITRDHLNDNYSYRSTQHMKQEHRKYGSMIILNREYTERYFSFVSEPYMMLRNMDNIIKDSKT